MYLFKYKDIEMFFNKSKYILIFSSIFFAVNALGENLAVPANIAGYDNQFVLSEEEDCEEAPENTKKESTKKNRKRIDKGTGNKPFASLSSNDKSKVKSSNYKKPKFLFKSYSKSSKYSLQYIKEKAIYIKNKVYFFYLKCKSQIKKLYASLKLKIKKAIK